MEMAGVYTPYADYRKSVASRSYTEERAMYLNDHNDGVPLLKSGIRECDIEKLDSLGVPLRVSERRE